MDPAVAFGEILAMLLSHTAQMLLEGVSGVN